MDTTPRVSYYENWFPKFQNNERIQLLTVSRVDEDAYKLFHSNGAVEIYNQEGYKGDQDTLHFDKEVLLIALKQRYPALFKEGIHNSLNFAVPSERINSLLSGKYKGSWTDLPLIEVLKLSDDEYKLFINDNYVASDGYKGDRYNTHFDQNTLLDLVEFYFITLFD